MQEKNQYIWLYVLGVILALGINIYSWHLPFFWDTLLTSTITQHFYKSGFHNFITPQQFDAGHPPLFYMYVTMFYKLFGRSLFAAHLSMLPFVLIGIISFIRIMQDFNFIGKQQLAGIILFFSIPAVITQYTLVSYDAVLLSLYLAGLVSFFTNRRFLFVIIAIAMTGISLRGLFCILSLSLTIFFLIYGKRKEWIRWNLLLLPAIVIAFGWYIFHYSQTGWFFVSRSEGWSNQRSMVNNIGFFKNSFSIFRCFIDLGMVIISFLSLFYIVEQKKIHLYTLLWLIPAITFCILFLQLSNPVNHRYFLIVYVLMLLPVIQFLSGRRTIYLLLTCFILISGNFQIYPGKISNGWDCTLVHEFYFPLNKEFNSFMDEMKLDKERTGTVFPMNVSRYQSNMEDDKRRMVNINGSKIDTLPYVLYSNVGNDFSDDQLDALRKWKIVKQNSSGLVTMILFQNPDSNIK
ncbi:MAG: hypothetical protein JWN78_1013 [Bacteroidota bacterium]|nr:hypothetical protein [Bacteroidota bacterium]